MYLPGMVMVGYYFERKRALATGLACCGSGIGAIVFAPLSSFLQETYDWRGATWIIAGLVLNGVIFSLSYLPVEETTKRARKHLGGMNISGNGDFRYQTDVTHSCTVVAASSNACNKVHVDENINDSSKSVTITTKVPDAISREREKESTLSASDPSQSKESEDVKSLSTVSGTAGYIPVLETGKRWSDMELTTASRVPPDCSPDLQASHSNIGQRQPRIAARVSRSDVIGTKKFVETSQKLYPGLKYHNFHHHLPQMQTKYCFQQSTAYSRDHHPLSRVEPSNSLLQKNISCNGHSTNDNDWKDYDSNEVYKQSVVSVCSNESVFIAAAFTWKPPRGVLPSVCRRVVVDSILEIFDVSLLRRFTFIIYLMSCFLCMAGEKTVNINLS